MSPDRLLSAVPCGTGGPTSEIDGLAATGVPVIALVGIGLAVLLVGLGLVLLTRARRSRAGLALGLVVLIAAGTLAVWSGTQPLARAVARPSCATGSGGTTSGGSGIDAASTTDHLVITQTSVDDAIAPGRPAEDLVGTVRNAGGDRTVITSITVSIRSVTKAVDAPAGTCDATDYVLVDPVMPVGVTLAAGAQTTFRGAAIGFVDKPVNQDACKGARITLLYTSA